MTSIRYFISTSGDNPVKKFIESSEPQTKKKIFKIFIFIEKYGIQAVFKHTKKLIGTPLWEIRILGKRSTRIIYATIYKNDILLLNCFLKKSQETPKKEINLSINRLLKWKEGK